jgi:tetratricopeptide (TPR) repeat protein
VELRVFVSAVRRKRWLDVTYQAKAHLALGFTQRALERYEAMLDARQARAETEPDRADYQRDLSVSYERMGDLYRALGQGDNAREAYLKALAIAERLAQAEPDRDDYQVDLVVSLVQVGTIGRSRELVERALAVLRTLHEDGRLPPQDEPKIAAAEELLRDLE